MYGKYNNTVGSSARECFVITPHNTNQLTTLPKALRAPSAGVIVLVAADSETEVAHPVLEGEIVNVRAKIVKATGTTVTGTIIGYA